MQFDFDIIVPAGTPKASPLITELPLGHGIIHEIGAFFPPGCATTVYVIVRRSLQQIAPANVQGAWNYDETRVLSSLEYPLTEPPFSVFVDCWSPDAIYQHKISITIDMRPEKGQDWQTFFAHLLGSQNAG